MNSLLTSIDGWSPGLLGAYITLRIASRTEFLKSKEDLIRFLIDELKVSNIFIKNETCFIPKCKGLTACVACHRRRLQQMLSFRNRFHMAFQYHREQAAA